MATFELYRRSTIGMCLTETLDEMVSSGTLSLDLAIQVLVQFDKVNKLKSGASFLFSEGSFDGLVGDCSPLLSVVQLTSEHSTLEQQEICRIRNEHPDDPAAISKNRVKGSLKVTRVFGAGFLKQRTIESRRGGVAISVAPDVAGRRSMRGERRSLGFHGNQPPHNFDRVAARCAPSDLIEQLRTRRSTHWQGGRCRAAAHAGVVQ